MVEQLNEAPKKSTVDMFKALVKFGGPMKKELMELEFQYNMQLKGMEVQNLQQRESQREDRKDERTKLQASQQSELIEQRKNNKPPTNFESGGNDIIGGGFDLGSFEPK